MINETDLLKSVGFFPRASPVPWHRVFALNLPHSILHAVCSRFGKYDSSKPLSSSQFHRMIFFFLTGEDAEDNLVSAPLQELFR